MSQLRVCIVEVRVSWKVSHEGAAGSALGQSRFSSSDSIFVRRDYHHTPAEWMQSLLKMRGLEAQGCVKDMSIEWSGTRVA